MKLIHLLGYQGAGKTYTIEALTRELTKVGKRVGTIKHIHEKDFEIDVPGKDSWRHGQAGASVVAMVTPHEFAIVKRKDMKSLGVSAILRTFKKDTLDYVFVEGFYKELESRPRMVRILCAATERDALSLIEKHPHRIAFITGRIAKRGKQLHGVPLIDLPGDAASALKLIEAV